MVLILVIVKQRKNISSIIGAFVLTQLQCFISYRPIRKAKCSFSTVVVMQLYILREYELNNYCNYYHTNRRNLQKVALVRKAAHICIVHYGKLKTQISQFLSTTSAPY
jgi:hypothetical protein